MAERATVRRLAPLIPLILSGILELLGIAAIIGGFYLISPIAGVFATGLGLIILGLIVDPPKIRLRKAKEQ